MNEPRLPGQQSVRRAIDVLFCFDSDARALSAAEVADRLAMNRTTAWRYLQTLTGTGLVRELGGGRFGLGARTVSLAETYTGQWGDLSAVAGAALVRLRDGVGETAALHVRQGWSRVVVRQVESHFELHRTYRDMGQPIPLVAGAPSLAILAGLPPGEQATYLEAHVEPGSPERYAVEQELRAIAARGWAMSRGARVPDVASLAVPIRDGAAQVLGAVNVTGPEDRVFASGIEQVAAEVTQAARWIERQLEEAPLTASPA